MDIVSTDDKTPQIEPNNELFDKILNDNHVFIEWLSHLEMLSYQQYRRTKTCDYAFSKENFFYEHVAMAFPTESPWRAKFNAEIRKMLQSGLLLKWKKVRIFFLATTKNYFTQTYWPPENECTSSARGGISATAIVSVSDMQGSFFILGLGIVVSVLIFGLESCFSKSKSSSDTPRSVKTFTP